MLQGGLVLLGVLVAGDIRGWAAPDTTRDRPTPLAEQRAVRQSLEATRGELTLARLELQRAERIIAYSAHYGVPADIAAAVYDIALAEGVDPALAFPLVKAESNFVPTATSPAGAIGYTQILPSTARLYEPGLTTAQLYEPRANLRLGFRYLRDLLERYEGSDGSPDATLRLALLAYNRGPARVQELLDAGQDPQNGYATTIMRGYRGGS